MPDESAQGMFVRPSTFTVVDFWTRSRAWWPHPAHLIVRYGDCPTLLNLVSFHMCRIDAGSRQTEAQALTELAHPGMATLTGAPPSATPTDETPGSTCPSGPRRATRPTARSAPAWTTRWASSTPCPTRS